MNLSQVYHLLKFKFLLNVPKNIAIDVKIVYNSNK